MTIYWIQMVTLNTAFTCRNCSVKFVSILCTLHSGTNKGHSSPVKTKLRAAFCLVLYHILWNTVIKKCEYELWLWVRQAKRIKKIVPIGFHLIHNPFFTVTPSIKSSLISQTNTHGICYNTTLISFKKMAPSHGKGRWLGRGIFS